MESAPTAKNAASTRAGTGEGEARPAGAGPLSARRVVELDGLRGFAILFVLIWHYIGLLLRVTWPELLPLKFSLIIFRSGVDLFFVLSGFLIAGILLDNRGSPHYFRTFYARRFLRIFPIYYLTVLVFAGFKIAGATGYLFDGEVPLWSYLTLTQNYPMVHHQSYGANWLAVTWSLAVEEQFYLLFPLLVRWASPTVLVRCFVAGVIGAPLLRVASFYGGGADEFAPYMWLPCRCDALFIGALIAFALRREGAVAWLRAHGRMLVGVFWGLLVGVGVLAAVLHRGIGFHSAIWGHTVLAWFYGAALLLVVLHAGEPGLAGLRRRWLVGLGEISYGVYLWHGIVLQAVFLLFASRVKLQDAHDLGLVGLALIVTWALCTASYRWMEKRAIRLGHTLAY